MAFAAAAAERNGARASEILAHLLQLARDAACHEELDAPTQQLDQQGVQVPAPARRLIFSTMAVCRGAQPHALQSHAGVHEVAVQKHLCDACACP